MLTLPLSLSPRWRRLLIDAAIAIVLILLVRAWLQKDMISGAAPVFSSADLSGQPVAMSSYRGEPMVLHFWATWCPVCSVEEGSIESLSEDYPLLGVAMQSGDVPQVEAHLSERKLTFRNVNDPNGALAQLYGVTAVPATFIIDGEGQVRFAERGWSSELGLRARLWWLSLFG